MARSGGWKPINGGRELDWNDEIGVKDDYVILGQGWVEDEELAEPALWDPVKELRIYLQTLFKDDEYVGYVTSSWERDGRFLPSKGSYDRTAGQILEELEKYGDIGAVLGDYNEQAGAWIRFNPLDGQGVKNSNVTKYRYALVESDTVAVPKQNAIIRELELPVAALVHSGGKSLHAIVKIEAANYEEYKQRVEYLYNILAKNGLAVDTQNKNPSRLSRMPGVVRCGRKQFLAGTNLGKSSWAEWKEWIESINDELPDPESLDEVWEHMPELAPPLIISGTPVFTACYEK